MDFFAKAKKRGWVCNEIVTRTFPVCLYFEDTNMADAFQQPMFPDDSGEESVRSTVHGWNLTRGATSS